MRKRLDQRLVELQLAPTRAKARDLIKRQFVRVAGEICDKPAREVTDEALVELRTGTPAFVSRGAEKLAPALSYFQFEARGRVALDIGASTGGFTEVLLMNGAQRVYAVDVGRDQLHPALRADASVVTLEGCDARDLDTAIIPEPIGAIVADVSFISLTKALPAALALAAPQAWLVALIKPQFELTPRDIAKSGIVRDGSARERAVAAVRHWLATQEGWRVAGVIPSPIAGGSGNMEFLIGALRDV